MQYAPYLDTIALDGPGGLAQIGQTSDSGESESEELSSEESSFLSLAQIGQDSSSSGNENSEDAPHTYPGGSDAEDGGSLAQIASPKRDC